MGTILHVNEIGLMAAIEEASEPGLRGRPFVVANALAPRAVVLDVSAEAHREGLRRGMALQAARALVPGLPSFPPRPEFYRGIEDRLYRIGSAFSPLVERAGRGHLFIDLAGTRLLFGPPEDAAQLIRARIMEETGLCPSLALASSKTVSKVATRVFRPAGFVALSPAEEGPLIRMQPVALLPGVGPLLSRRLDLLGIEDIGELADLSEAEARALGPRGPELAERARGIDRSPVDPEAPERRALKGEAVLEPDTADPAVLRLRTEALCAELAFSLRREGRGARRVRASLAYTDGVRSEAQASSPRLLSRDDELSALALSALGKARDRRVRVRRLELCLLEIDAAGPELDLFEPEDLKLSRLQPALDRIRTKWGFSAIGPCSFLAAGT